VSTKERKIYIYVVATTFMVGEKFGDEVGDEVGGFLVVSSLPSKALLETSLPKILQETRIGKEVIRLLQGYFYNKLGSLSRKFYTYILPRYTIKTVFGYILPPVFLNEFTSEINELKKEYEKYERELRAFLREGKIPDDLPERAEVNREYVELIKSYLKMSEIPVPEISSRMRIDLIPFVISRRVIETLAQEKVKQSTLALFEETKAEIFNAVAKNIEEALNNIVEKIKEYQKKTITQRALKAIREDVERAVAIAYQYNIDSERVKILVRMREELMHIERGELAEEVGGRLGVLIKEMGL